MQFKWMTPIVVVLALSLAIGIASAQEDEATTEPETTEATTTAGWHPGRGAFGPNPGWIEEATGLTIDEVRAALADGATLAELIEANGGDVDALVAELVAAQQERIESFEANLRALLNGEAELPLGPGMRGFGPGMRDGFGLLPNLIEEATGLTSAEVRTALADGATLAELIAANGGDVDALVAELVAAQQERLMAAVEAGRLTQAEADERLSEFEANVTAVLNGDMELPFGDGGRGPGGGRGGR